MIQVILRKQIENKAVFLYGNKTLQLFGLNGSV